MSADKILDNLLEDKNNIYAHEDTILDPLLPVIDQIQDTSIRMFVRSVLMKAPPFFWKIGANLDNDTYAKDEAEEGGLVLHTIRVARVVASIANLQDRTQRELDLLLAATLLHDLTKAVEENDGTIGYDPMHAYTVDGYVQWVQDYDDKYSDDGVSSTLYIDEEAMHQITRIIRCHKGAWSIVPETIPLTQVEWTLAIAEDIVSKLPHIIDGKNPKEWRWIETSGS